MVSDNYYYNFRNLFIIIKLDKCNFNLFLELDNVCIYIYN